MARLLTFFAPLVGKKFVLAQFLEQFVDSTCLEIGNGSCERAWHQFVVFHAHLDGCKDPKILLGKVSEHRHVEFSHILAVSAFWEMFSFYTCGRKRDETKQWCYR